MENQHKRIVLTGASSGIGLDLLRILAQSDCQIVAVARTIEKIKDAYPNVKKYPCDISRPENIDALFSFAIQEMGGIDLYIANAGFAYYGKIQEPSWKEIAGIYETNVFSAIYAAEKMKELHGDKPFQVTITASAMSFLSYPGYTLYASTKAALHGFATGYRSELSRGQNLQMVYPIGTRTKFFQQAGARTPVPWPTQSSKKVACTIADALSSGKNAVFPSKLFWTLNLLNGFCPLIFKMIMLFEQFKFQRWLKKNASVS